MDNEDFEYLCEHQESCHPLHAPMDYQVRVSERVLHLSRADYFLGSRDADWHLPLLVTLREEGTKNYRQRSKGGWQKLKEKQQAFQQRVKDKKKGGSKGKDESRASVQPSTKGKGKEGPQPWNAGQRRSIYEDPENYEEAWWPTWSSWYDQPSWTGGSAGSSSWYGDTWSSGRYW